MKKIHYLFAVAVIALCSCGNSGNKVANDSNGGTETQETEAVTEAEPDGDDYAYLAEMIEDGDELSNEDYMTMLKYMDGFAEAAERGVAETGVFNGSTRQAYAELNARLTEEFPFMHDYAGAVVKGVQKASANVSPEVVEGYRNFAARMAKCQGIRW